MKANGTPAAHYRFEETKLVQRLAEFLNVMLLHIHAWTCLQSPNEDSQNRPSDEVNSDQIEDQNQPDEMGEKEPIHSAESAQSITYSDLQTRQHNYNQDIQHNSYSAAVVDTQSEGTRRKAR